MAGLIVEGKIHQFVTTYSEVRLCYVTSLATALSITIIFCFSHAKCFNLSKYKWRGSTRHICDSTASCPFNQYDCVTQDREAQQIINIQLPDVTESLGEDYVSSVERIEPVHSKAREMWGHLKSWKRIPGSTKHSGKWVTMSNVKPHASS